MTTTDKSEQSVPTSTLWRHRKTGGVYTISGMCQIEATNEPGVLYSSVQHEGPLWCRPISEFIDGRFEPIKIF
jgi:hypothetical protein